MPRVYEILLFSAATLPPKKVMCVPSKHIISFFSLAMHIRKYASGQRAYQWEKRALVKNSTFYQKQDPGGRIVLRATRYNVYNVVISFVNVSMLVRVRSVVLL